MHASLACLQGIQGILCGDCLWVWYGENVEEAKANNSKLCTSKQAHCIPWLLKCCGFCTAIPSSVHGPCVCLAEWICPCCRDICQSNTCREQCGWSPLSIGTYPLVKAKGFPSMAHFLVLRLVDRESPEAKQAAQELLGVLQVGTLALGGDG